MSVGWGGGGGRLGRVPAHIDSARGTGPVSGVWVGGVPGPH